MDVSKPSWRDVPHRATRRSSYLSEAELGAPERAQYQSVQGLLRARGRDAPSGYESGAHWTAEGTPGLATLQARSQDRIAAENRRQQDAYQASLSDPRTMNIGGPAAMPSYGLSGNWGPFFEALQHNDVAAGILDKTYMPKQTNLRLGPSPAGSNAIRGFSEVERQLGRPGQGLPEVNRRLGPAVRGLQQTAPSGSQRLDDMLAASAANRQRGNAVRRQYGGRVPERLPPNMLGRF